ncbi:MAG TPA: FxsA family protein [Nocardioidaceae bacterium]|nr:FxsA family protein [Nocardioidaceae bacterium]
MKSVRIRWIPAALLLLPVVEVVVIVVVASQIGWGVTIALLAGISIAGAVLVRHVGRRAWAELAKSRSVGTEPTRPVADRALTFVGGLMLIPPGFVTDVAALVLLLPFTRPLVRGWLQRWAVRQGAMFVTVPPDPMGSRHGTTTPHGPDVVHGEVIEDT